MRPLVHVSRVHSTLFCCCFSILLSCPARLSAPRPHPHSNLHLPRATLSAELVTKVLSVTCSHGVFIIKQSVLPQFCCLSPFPVPFLSFIYLVTAKDLPEAGEEGVYIGTPVSLTFMVDWALANSYLSHPLTHPPLSLSLSFFAFLALLRARASI